MKNNWFWLILVIGLGVIIFTQLQKRNASGLARMLEQNAVSMIEFFPSKSERLHLNIKYDSSGNTLIIKIDDWKFNRRNSRERHNWLRVYHLPMSAIDAPSIEVLKESMPVGPIGHKAGKIELSPRRIVLPIKSGGEKAFLTSYDKGRGPSIGLDSGRWSIPSEAGDTEYPDSVELHAPTEAFANLIAGKITALAK